MSLVVDGSATRATKKSGPRGSGAAKSPPPTWVIPVDAWGSVRCVE